MFKILTNADDVLKAHTRFIESLGSIMDELIETNIGHAGGSFPASNLYSSKYKFWCVLYEDAFEANRYWNAFGINKPKSSKSSSIDVEINYPIEGIDKSISSIFVKDGNQLKIFHNGRIGGGRKGIGQTAFYKYNKLPVHQINIGGQDSSFVEVCNLDSYEFPTQIKAFISQVWNIKNVITNAGSLE